jgi:enoyl-CoA hydratase
MSDAPRISIDREDGVALVTLRRPERRNALDDRLLTEELPAAWAALADDEETAVVVITGEGQAFCGGADLEGCSGFRRADVADGEDFTRSTLEPVVAQYRLPQLTIAAVNGAAAGAGFGIALACDMRIGSPRARFLAPFVKMGLVPDYGLSWFLPRVVPMPVALDIMMTGRIVEAGEALQVGILSRIVDDPVMDALAYGRQVAAGPRRALRVTKHALYRALDLDVEEAILIEEARSQAIALFGSEFPPRFEAWRSQIRGG